MKRIKYNLFFCRVLLPSLCSCLKVSKSWTPLVLLMYFVLLQMDQIHEPLMGELLKLFIFAHGQVLKFKTYLKSYKEIKVILSIYFSL